MPRIQTKFFGEREFETDALYSFPSGLPGFEDQRSFLFLKIAGAEPLLFMQSMSTPHLCFVLLPILVVDPDYQLTLMPEELSELRLPANERPVIGRDVLCAAMVCTGDGRSPTANLMAPVIVNLRTNVGLQAIQGGSGYSHQHRLRYEEALVSC